MIVGSNIPNSMLSLQYTNITYEGLIVSINRQSPVKNQQINHNADNFYVLTKVPHNTKET